MKKIMFSLMAIVSLASCTKEELEPKITLHQPYEGGYVVYFHEATFTVAKIVVGEYTYNEAQSFEQFGWYIPSVDELAHEAKFSGLPNFFTLNGYNEWNNYVLWTSTPAPYYNSIGQFFDWQYSVSFTNNIFWSSGPDEKTTKRNVILFKKFAR